MVKSNFRVLSNQVRLAVLKYIPNASTALLTADDPRSDMILTPRP